MPVVRSKSQEAGQSPAGKHPVDGGTRHAQAPGHQMRAFLLYDPIRNDPLFHLRRDPIGTVTRPRRTIQKTGFSFLFKNVSSTDRRSAEKPPPTRRPGPPANPTRGSDPPTNYARTVSTFYSWFSRGPPFDSRNVAYPTNQTRRPSLIQAFCQPRPWEGQLGSGSSFPSVGGVVLAGRFWRRLFLPCFGFRGRGPVRRLHGLRLFLRTNP